MPLRDVAHQHPRKPHLVGAPKRSEKRVPIRNRVRVISRLVFQQQHRPEILVVLGCSAVTGVATANRLKRRVRCPEEILRWDMIARYGPDHAAVYALADFAFALLRHAHNMHDLGTEKANNR